MRKNNASVEKEAPKISQSCADLVPMVARLFAPMNAPSDEVHHTCHDLTATRHELT